MNLRAPGLCSACRHARHIESARGSTFWLCDLSRRDASFPKYPRLPVLSCAGFEREPNERRENGDTTAPRAER